MTVVVSNRGPYRFVARPDGGFETKLGAGGVASSLGPLLTSGVGDGDIAWIAAAVDEDDRRAVAAGAVAAPGVRLTLLTFEERRYRQYYDVISNGVLWFLHHGLFDLPRRPRFDDRFREAWEGYVAVNQAFADAAQAAVAADDDVVLVQDYQLALVPGMLQEAAPGLRVVHFTHTPFCGPSSVRVLPDDVARAICGSMATVPCGFHSERWARSYAASVREILGTGADPPTFVASLGPDLAALREVSTSAAARTAAAALDELLGDRALLLRVDRVDPSKNIVRGFAAFDLALDAHPELRDRVVFLARLNASRETMPEYLAYRNEVERAAADVNTRWGTDGWQPVVLDTRDDFPSTVAALERYDALLVNPVRDGLNLVAKEGPLLNARDGLVCLSPAAGAFDELGSAVIATHPFDLRHTADAIHTALTMPAPERAARAAELRRLAGARTPRDWLDDQLRAAGVDPPRVTARG